MFQDMSIIGVHYCLRLSMSFVTAFLKKSCKTLVLFSARNSVGDDDEVVEFPEKHSALHV
jgi:hypothetical protein